MIRKVIDGLLKWIYPVQAQCQGCMSAAGHEQGWLCTKCREDLSRSWVGAAPAPGDCRVEGAAFAYHYVGPAGSIVRNMKYRGVHQMGAMMACDMVKALRALEPIRVDCVVPVPMHALRRRLRGYNQAEILALHVARLKNVEMTCLLSRPKYTRQQARLSGEQRRYNLKSAIEVTGDVAGKAILLVDDVCTTGATAAACEKALRAAGASQVYLVCYALARER